MAQAPPTVVDAFKLWREGGDVVIEFGNVMAPSPQGAAAVTASDRVVLPLDVGRRLIHSLGDALKPHAARLRAAEAQALSPGDAAAALGGGARRLAPDAAGDTAAQLLQAVGNLGVPYAYERSFRVTKGALAANRFVLSVGADSLSGKLRRRPLEIGTELGMPESLRQAAEAALDTVSCFHFGFEAEADAILCKLYLERRVPESEASEARARGEGVPVHLAVKWDTAGPTAVTTRYLWHQVESAAEIEARLDRLYDGDEPASLAIVSEVLRIAAQRIAPPALQYFEVTEDENARRSFDLNLYNAKLKVRDVQAPLFRMRDHFGLRPGQFQALYDQIKGKVLGHISGGIHRNGRDFFNVYYGVMGVPQFHQAFR